MSCSAGQDPLPSQVAACTATPALHEASRQLVPLPGYAQAAGWVPSHAPPQTEPSDTQAVRALRGAPATGVQVPALPLSAHASHWPVHAVSQQTPSTQCCDPHWFAPPQAWPGVSSGTQTPAEHQSPFEQSESALQFPVQPVGPQLKGAHVCVCTAGQAPAPSQDSPSVAIPAEQEGARHDVELPGYVQPAGWTPSQLPPQTVPSEAQALRAPCGAPVAGEQVPTLPATSHASHCPPQARSQQNPSAQEPVAHSWSPPQALACAFFATQAWLLSQ